MAATKRKRKTVAKQTEVKSDTGSMQVGKYSLKKSFLLWLIPIVVLVLLLYLLKGFFIAATVNGQPISRLSVIQTLEKRSGKQVLRSQVLQVLLTQEAKKKNITISQKDTDAELKKISDSLKSQGQTLDQALSDQGMTRQDLNQQIEQQLILEKILADKTKVTDKEVSDFIDKNKASFPEGTSEDQMKQTAKSQLQNTKFSTEANTYLDTLLKQAKINYFVNYP